MSNDQADTRAVRALVRPRTITSAEELAHLRERVLTGVATSTAARPRSRPALRRTVARQPVLRRWVVPLAAAVVVLVLAAGVGVVLGRGRSGAPTASPSGGVPVLVRVGPLDVSTCLAELAKTGAGAEPVTLRVGDLLYVRSDNLVPAGGRTSSLVPQVHEVWFDPQGMITVREKYDGSSQTGPKGESQAYETAAERAEFAASGPGPYHPTHAWLAELPTDPDALLSRLRPASPEPDADAVLWTIYRSLFTSTEPLLPAGLRVALFGAMARIPGVTATEVRLDGRALYALGRRLASTGGAVQELLFDPSSGRTVGAVDLYYPPGTQSGGGGQPSPSPGADARPTGSEPVVTMRWLYTYRVEPA